MYIILSLLFAFSISAQTNHDELASSVKWQRLLHYKKKWWGGIRSEADGEKFFLHPEGKSSPLKELQRNIELFSQFENLNNDHAICRFPLRYKWLNKQLGMPWKANLMQCENYVKFFSKMAATRASVVFSSYYLGNPNSAFGHTLLRLSRYKQTNETEMLDYGINYSAVANESNPLLYAVKGLFGGFEGKFAAIPYYYKIREYTNVEFRDLWSYDLRLTAEEVLEMVDHVWELGQTYFDYYYFHENCSYHLLSIIEVVLPEVSLTDRYDLYTIPADTVRHLKELNLIEDGRMRESTYSKLTRTSSKLTQESLDKAKEIANHPQKTNELISGLDNQKAADILDVSIEAFDYYNFEKILQDDKKTKEAKNNILLARAKNPVITYDSIDPAATKKDSPALSHAPTRLTLSEGYIDQRGKFTGFEFRAALHDMLDPPHGSMKTGQIEMAKLSFRYQEKDYGDSHFLFNSLSLFNLKNYPEQNFWSSPTSWEVDVGGKQMNPQQCYDCPGIYLLSSLGNSIQVNHEKILFSFLINGELNLQSQFEQDYRIGIGPKIFSRYLMTDHWVLGLSSWYHFNTYQTDKIFQDHLWHNELELRYHLNPKLSLAIKGQGIEMNDKWMTQGEFGLQYFYE